MNIFVGNLSFDAREADVKKLFEGFGSVASVAIVMDKKGRDSRGFGFVEMPDDQQALAAITALNSQEFMGRPLNVEAGRPKTKAGPESIKRRQVRSGINIAVQQQHRGEDNRRSARVKPAFEKGGRYKQGRRSRSFMERRAADGIEEPVIKRKIYNNPMRWRKIAKPRQKTKNVSKLSKSKT